MIATIATALGTTAATAQCPPSAGPFLGAPAALSVDEATAGGWAADDAWFKPVGLDGTVPRAFMPTAWAPDLRLRDAFISCGMSRRAPIDIDALSNGDDWVVANAVGRVAVPANQWAALTLSVSPTSRGKTGSRLRAEANAGQAGGDIFSYVLPGSALPPELVDRTERAIDSDEMRLGTRNVDALDHFLSMFELDAGIAPFLNSTSVYFSVSDATKQNVPVSWWGTFPPSGAHIFEMTYTPNGWSCPTVFKSAAELGLQDREDVDALALDLDQCQMLFSTKTRTRNEILFLRYCVDFNLPIPYEAPDGTPISDEIGLLIDDDVDAICATDPTIRGQPASPNASWWFQGTPLALQPGNAPVAASASAFRTENGGTSGLETWLAGWPRNGAGPGLAAVFLSPPNDPTTLIPLTGFVRNPAPNFCGDPIGTNVTIPAVLDFRALSLDVRWYVVGSLVPPFTLDEVHPLRFHL